jgi:hypothetical protein
MDGDIIDRRFRCDNGKLPLVALALPVNANEEQFRSKRLLPSITAPLGNSEGTRTIQQVSSNCNIAGPEPGARADRCDSS